MGIFIGDQFKLYRDTADSFGTPTWSEVTLADDLSLDFNPNDVAIQTRGSDYIQHAQGKKDPVITCTVVYDSADAHIAEFETHSVDGGNLHMGVFDGSSALSGTEYWHQDCEITGFSLGVNNGDAATYDITFSHGSTSNTPARATVA